MTSLRIAMICDMVPGQAGGSYISTVRFAERLRASGHHVILITARDTQKPPVHEYRGIPIYQFFSLPTPGSNRYYFQSFPRKKQLREIFTKEQIQIVHIMFPSYSCGLAKRIARSLKLPVVAHIHTQPENISIFLPRFLRTKTVDALILAYLVRFVRGSNRIICPSELGKRIYQEADPNLPITVLSNGVDLTEWNNTPPVTHTVRGARILFVGRLTLDKDPETLIRAIPFIRTAIPNLQVDIIGTGPLQSELMELTELLNIEQTVRFCGRVSDAELKAAYRAASLFILPSHVELEGMVVLEAMAMGLPVMVADSLTSASRYFVQGNGYTFTPGDSNDLAQKASKILADPALAHLMHERGLELARSYSIDESVKKLEKIYYSVLS